MEFKVGDKFTIRPEAIESSFQLKDCTPNTVYTIHKVHPVHKSELFYFLDDVGDELAMYSRKFKYLEFINEGPTIKDPKDVPDFMGYETAKDFELIIEYALAHNDIYLFEECVEELKNRNLLEEYASLD